MTRYRHHSPVILKIRTFHPTRVCLLFTNIYRNAYHAAQLIAIMKYSHELRHFHLN